MPKKILISMPEELLEEVDSIVAARYKNRSEFVRDALRKGCSEFYQSRTARKEMSAVMPGVPLDEVPNTMTGSRMDADSLTCIQVDDADRIYGAE